MLTNKVIVAAALAALTGEATAFNSHRHLHRQVEKRAMETDWVTVWETIYVTEGAEIPAPTPDVPVADTPAEPDVDAPPPPPAPITSSTTSTVVVVAPTEKPAAPVGDIVDAPSPVLTTLSTAVKPPVEESTPEEPAPEPQPAPEPEPEPVEESIPPVLNPAEPEPTTETPPPSGGGSPPSGKRGLAYNDGNMANLFNDACESCAWAYNWASSRNDLDDSVDFVPMLWGDADLHTGHWDENCENELSKGAKALFSFNEPDHATQANISPAQAAASHVKFMNKYSGRALIGAPSVTNSGNPGEGLEWLASWVAACDAQGEKCAYDFCNVHWYSEAQYANTLFEHLEKAHEICGGKPVWLTEFAPLGSDEQISEFMQNVIPELDNIEYLEAYSYFMVSAGSLMSSPSALSGYGQLYATV